MKTCIHCGKQIVTSYFEDENVCTKCGKHLVTVFFKGPIGHSEDPLIQDSLVFGDGIISVGEQLRNMGYDIDEKTVDLWEKIDGSILFLWERNIITDNSVATDMYNVLYDRIVANLNENYHMCI